MKLSRNLKHLLFLVISSYIIYYSECLENTNHLTYKNLNSNHYGNQNSVSITSSTKVAVSGKSNLNLNGGIFMDSRNLKHKKIKTSLDSMYSTVSEIQEKLAEKAKKNHSKEKQDITALNRNSEIAKKTDFIETAYKASRSSYVDADNKRVDLSKAGPVLMHSWVKYFKYRDETLEDQKAKSKFILNTPKKFFTNNEFQEQKKTHPSQDYSIKDDQGEYKFVKSEDFFYMVVYKNIVTFFSAKEDNQNIRKVQESFMISDIRLVYEDTDKFGAVVDFGNFNEGSCAKVTTREHGKIVWVVCFELDGVKSNFLSLLRNLKIDEQHEDGLVLLKYGPKNNQETVNDLMNMHKKEQSQKLTSDKEGNLNVQFDTHKNQTLIDGYWITIQNWTQCSLKCGGGTSTLQRMCIAPKNGGAPCKGESIITKPCNTQPCPEIFKASQKNGNETIKKPIIKSLALSKKPQRYLKCKIKESDLMLFFNVSDPLFRKNPFINPDEIGSDVSQFQFPIRVVMNNSTLTLYTGETSESLYISFNLASSRFLRIKRKECFKIYESAKKYVVLCPFGCDNTEKAVEEWDYDFNLFKHQCNYKKPHANVEDKLKDKIKEAKNQLLLDEQKIIRVRMQKEESDNLDVIIKNTNAVALQAIQKEINLEALIQKEEEERVEREKRELILKIEEERKRKDCVLKAIKERELENQYNINARKAQETIESIKRDTAQEVLIKRSKLQDRIKKIRENAEREKNKLKQKLQSVRYSIADEINSHYKKGDINKCIMAMENEKRRNDYCISTFSEDFSDLNYCRKTSEFCTFCCNTEISEIYLPARQECYTKVCVVVPPPSEDPTGKWVWHDSSK